ncbi:transglycosylase SLT domain-containing protein [Massilia sp. CT11-137]|uniref:transglycosylase SLT domain-containing protein n=1 Tax=Massilia sp. CT11-137 TaxID=3393901 RepID=UPI0039B0C29A
MSIFEVEAQMQASPEYENRQVTSPDARNFDAYGNLLVNYRPGDTLQALAQVAYGDSSLAYLIAQANGITSGTQLATLDAIIIPKANLKSPTRYGTTIVQYKPGDTVESLAEQAYGDSGYWELIAKQNNITWYDDLSKLGSIAIPDLSVLQDAGDRAEGFLEQLQAWGFNEQLNGSIVVPARASGASQGALDYANEMSMAGMDWNAIDDVRNSATDSARVSAAWYLMSHPNAADSELYSEYISEYNYRYDDGMSSLARQVGAAYDGDRIGDYAAMAAGGFASDGPDFGRMDLFSTEMKNKITSLYGGKMSGETGIDALFPTKTSVKDLTAEEFGKLEIALASLAEYSSSQGGSNNGTSDSSNDTIPEPQRVVVVGDKTLANATDENDEMYPSLTISQLYTLYNSFAGPVTRMPKTREQIEAEVAANIKADAEQRVANVIKYLDEAKEAVGDTGWDPLLLLAMAARESAGDPEAGKGHGYKGLVQLGKQTWDEAVSKDMIYLADYKSYDKNWNDPLANLSVAATALEIKKDSLHVPDGNPAALELALLAYNGGQGAVLKAIDSAKAAGEKDPYVAAATEKYLSQGVGAYPSVYGAYMDGGRLASKNQAITNRGNAAEIKAAAVSLELHEMLTYPTNILNYYDMLKGKVSGSGH